MTPETLSELKSLLGKSTPGEWCDIWTSQNDGLTVVVDHKAFFKLDDEKVTLQDRLTEDDISLVCALRNSAPDLIKAVEQRDRYRAALERARKDMVILIGDQEYEDERSICREGIADIDYALKDTQEETNDTRSTA